MARKQNIIDLLDGLNVEVLNDDAAPIKRPEGFAEYIRRGKFVDDANKISGRRQSVNQISRQMKEKA